MTRKPAFWIVFALLSAVAIWQAWKVVKAPGYDEQIRGLRGVAYATMTGGILTFMMSAGLVLLFLAIVLLYVGMFVLMMIMGIAGAAAGG